MSTEANQQSRSSDKFDRRKFIGLATAMAGVMFIKPELVHGTAANSAVRVGLLGCGGRGTEDASNLVDTGNARVVALADLFRDQLDAAHAHFDEIQKAKRYAAIDAAQLFVGPSAYKEIAASKDVDAIVIATPPYYHPRHLEAAVAAGKHVYLEKPVAVDVPGALKVIEIGKRAEGKLSLDVGFQIRDCPPFVEMVRRIHDGAIGKIVCGEAYYLTGYIERPPWPNASQTERRLRNWVHDRKLSGDIVVEQNVTFSSTQFAKGWWDVTERFFGTKGTSQSPYVGPLGIWGDEPWQASAPEKDQSEPQAFSVTGKFSSNLDSADPAKKKAFIESITSGNFHSQAAKGSESAISCMVARTAAYKGHEVTWDEIMKSKEEWDPKINLEKLT